MPGDARRARGTPAPRRRGFPYASGMLVARPGRSPVMVGRGAELERLVGVVGSDATAGPTVALIAGEAGVGKTRLVRELLDRVAGEVPVLAGQADPGALGRPFELLLDAIDAAAFDADAVAAIGDRSRPIEERLDAGIAVVREAVDGRPTLLVFEDLHWADSESLTLFERLAEPDCGPLMLVGTYRPDAVHRRHPVSDLLPRLERRHAVTHVRLGRLGPARRRRASWAPCTAARRRTGWSRRSTPAPAATRTSSRSCSSRPASRSTPKSSSTSGCRGAWPS